MDVNTEGTGSSSQERTIGVPSLNEASTPRANGGYRALGPDELPHLQDLEAESFSKLYRTIFPLLKRVPRVQDPVAVMVTIQKAISDIASDSPEALGLLRGSPWRVSLKSGPFGKALMRRGEKPGEGVANDSVIELNWSVLLDPDPELIRLALGKLLLPHEVDRIRLELRPALKPSERAAISPAVTEGWEECITLLRDVQRIMALELEDRERLLGFIEKNEMVEEGHRTYLNCLKDCLEHPDKYLDRVHIIATFVAQADVYDTPGRPSADDLKLGLEKFAFRIEKIIGGLMNRETRDAYRELIEKADKTEESAELKEILSAAADHYKDGLGELRPPPQSAQEWLGRMILEQRVYELLAMPAVKALSLIREMDHTLPLSSAALKDDRWLDLMEAPLMPRLNELIARIPQAHFLSEADSVREVRIFLTETGKLLQEYPQPTVEQLAELEQRVEALILRASLGEEGHPELSAQSELLSLEMALQTLDAEGGKWGKTELFRVLSKSMELGQKGDIEQVADLEEESIPLTQKEWVKYVIQRGHIRRIANLGTAQMSVILDLQKVMLPLSALAKLYIQCWDHYLMNIYMDVSDEHARLNENRHQADVLTDLQQSSFSYDAREMEQSVCRTLEFLLGDEEGEEESAKKHGPDLLSPRLGCKEDGCEGSLLVCEFGEETKLADSLEDPQCAKVWEATNVFRGVLRECILGGCEDLKQYPEVYSLLRRLAQKENEAGRL